MKPIISLLFGIICLSPYFASAENIIDPYSGKWTPCENNDSYSTDLYYKNENSLSSNDANYACIYQTSDGLSNLMMNWKIDPKYTGVISFNYSYSWILIAYIKKDNMYSVMIWDYTSPSYKRVPQVIYDSRWNSVITFQEKDTFNWIYNGIPNQSKNSLFVIPYSVFGWERILISEYNDTNNQSFATSIYFQNKPILTEYSAILYAGENYWFTGSQEVYLLGQKWDYVELVAVTKEGKIKIIKSVKWLLDQSTYVVFDWKDYTNFAFAIKKWSNYRLVTNKWVSVNSYDTIDRISYYEGIKGLFKIVSRGGKYYFSIWDKWYGPYDTIGWDIHVNKNQKSWFIDVTRDNKSYIIVNWKEIAL